MRAPAGVPLHTAPAATTRPSWASSSGARRGDVAGAMLDYLIYMSNIDGRETILASFLSSHGQPLRAVAWHLELRCGQMVLEACVGGVRGKPLRGVARGRPPAQYYYSGTACQCMCACSQRADVPAFVPRVVPHAVSAHARLEACWRGGAAPCMLSTAM